MKHWLLKSEPEVYGIEALERDGATGWEGVRNYQARNFMRDEMRPGDLALFYHSNAEPSGVAGVARILETGVVDPSQFDRRSPYFDESSPRDEPRWVMARVGFHARFPAVVPLAVLKADPALAGMAVLQKGQRLSVMPVTPAHFARVLALGTSALSPPAPRSAAPRAPGQAAPRPRRRPAAARRKR